MKQTFDQSQLSTYMTQALALAQVAYAQGEVPVGALVVNAQGVVIGTGYNRVEQLHSQTEHAESMAIQEAGKQQGDWRLQGCWLFVTLEPCSMCMYLIYLSRISGLVYGAPSPLFGYHLDSAGATSLYKKDALIIIPNVHATQAGQLLKNFFQEQRKKRE